LSRYELLLKVVPRAFSAKKGLARNCGRELMND